MVPEDQPEPGRQWYLPHFAVYHSKKPNQIRVVFDCSANFEGECLNKHLLQGPDLMNKLVGVLTRFREEKVAIMCDVERMFHSFKVNEEHRNYLRFLWFRDGNLAQSIATYRMNVHLFGAVSSPGCANFGLRKTAQEGESRFGETVAKFLRDDFYVDDGLKSIATIPEAVDLIEKSREMCAKDGIRLHKFTSNSLEVLEAVSNDDRATDLKNLDLRRDILPIQRSLGTYWCIESDTFQFRITLKDKPFTRRGILSTVSSVYDPLGIACPVILAGKLLLRELVQQKADWDDLVPEEIRPRWQRWRTQLYHLHETMRVPRCFKPHKFGSVKSIEIHSFSDASQVALGQVSYLRFVDDQNCIHVSFLMAKARVAPLRVLSIPRLELTAAVVSANVVQLLVKELDYHVDAELYYTDSAVVLGYIRNRVRRFHMYVGNRVQQIHDLTVPESWRHVKGEENPADIASRSSTAKELCDSALWFRGPEFLWQKELPERSVSEVPTLDDNDPEVKVLIVNALSVKPSKRFVDSDFFRRFSSWSRLKRAVALAMKYVAILQAKISNRKKRTKPTFLSGKGPSTPISVEVLTKAENVILKCVQRSHFKDEINVLQALTNGPFLSNGETRNRNQKLKQASTLYRLDPFLDQEGILRVGGRMKRANVVFQQKHPAIIPKKSHITTLLVRHYNETVKHQGRLMTLNEIRQCGYWIIHGRSTITSYISKCVTCRRLRGLTEVQKMADLPSDRITEVAPFTYAGVDAFGPWYIKEGRKTVKRYGIIFTCLASRAIHLETANTMNTDSFICALRRFISRRGPVRKLRSDCGTNFVGAKQEFTQAWKQMNQDTIQRFLLMKNCDWVQFDMNVPHASHMGGVWERQIRSVRAVMSTLLGELGEQLDDETLRTLFSETENIVNCRPLTADLSDPNSPEPTTPMQLLTLKSRIVLPPPGEFCRSDIYSRKRWKRVQYLANQFWQRWRKEFLQTLQARQKWQTTKRNLQVGDIVIEKDESLPRNQWVLAYVSKQYPSQDGHIRKVQIRRSIVEVDAKGTIKSKLNVYDRPVHKLVLLVEAADNENTKGNYPLRSQRDNLPRLMNCLIYHII